MYFRVDVLELDKLLENYMSLLKKVSNNTGEIYDVLEKVSSYWNDATAINFMNKLAKEEMESKKYLSNLEKTNNEIRSFLNFIKNAFGKFYSANGIRSVYYDDSKLYMCMQYISESITLLYRFINNINLELFIKNYEIYNLMKNIIMNINNYISEINNFLYNLKSLYSNINSNIILFT